MSKRLVAIGAAHLDVLAISHGDPHGIDQPGEIRFEVGGTAANIAINWVKMGAQGVLLSALRPGPIAAVIERHLAGQGVEPLFDFNPHLSAGAYCAHLDADGELLAAISDSAVEHHSFSEERLEDALEEADMVVADCNLSEDALAAVGMEAIAHAIPLYIRAVSEEKSLRMAAIRGLPTLVSLTEREARYFLFQIQNRILKDPVELARAVAEFMKCDCLLMLQERGAIYAPPDAPPQWERQDDFAFAGNRLGAEEGLLAAFVLACSHGATPRMALPRALRVAGLIGNKDQVNLGESNPLDLALEELLDHALASPPRESGPASALDRRAHESDALSAMWFELDLSNAPHSPLEEAMRELHLAAQSSLRRADAILRWTPQEMVCLLPQTALQHARAIAQRVMGAFEQSPSFQLGARLRGAQAQRESEAETLFETINRAHARAQEAEPFAASEPMEAPEEASPPAESSLRASNEGTEAAELDFEELDSIIQGHDAD